MVYKIPLFRDTLLKLPLAVSYMNLQCEGTLLISSSERLLCSLGLTFPMLHSDLPL